MAWLCGFLLGIAVGKALLMVMAYIIAASDKDEDVKK